MKQPPKIGERLVVHGMSRFAALVESVEWNADSNDWLIRLDWGNHGKSRVWLHDEGKIWKKWMELN
jgi:hypothetical protein